MEDSNLLLLLTAALLASAAHARPQTQNGREDSVGSVEQRPWQPSLEKDQWRAFKPEEQVSRDRWWEMRLDDSLWEVPASEPLSAGEPTSKSLQNDGEAAPSAAQPLPSNPLSMPKAPSSTSVPVPQSQPKVSGTSSIASQVAAIAAAAKALLKVKKTNGTTSTSNSKDIIDNTKDAEMASPKKDAEEAAPKKDNLPGETGYLQPFYRKGNNNPFVVDDDTVPFYGTGMNWRNGRPYLPVLHKDTVAATTAKPLPFDGIPIVEGGVSSSVDLPTPSPLSLEDGNSNDIPQDTSRDDLKATEPEKIEKKETPGPDGIASSVKITDPDDSKPTEKAQESKDVDPVTVENHEEMPQSDQPFVDWPGWDSSLFDDFQDDDEKDEDASKIKDEKESAPTPAAVKTSEKLDLGVKERVIDEKKIEKDLNGKDASKGVESQASDLNEGGKQYDYDEDYYDYDFDDDEEDESDDEDNEDESDDEDDEDESDSDDDDDDEEEDEEEENDDSSDETDKSISGSSSSSSSDSKLDNLFDNEYDDSYYYDDDDDEENDDHSEWKKDSYEVLEKQNGAITISPIKTSTTAAYSRVASRKKRLDWDKIPVSAEQLSHDSHYDRGVIYDAPSSLHANDKGSFSSKGSDINVHLEKGSDLAKTKDEAQIFQDSNPTIIRSGKTGVSAQFEPTNVHTESDASTSPNPRPPIVTGAVSQTTVMSTTPTTMSSSSFGTSRLTTSTTTTTTTTEIVKPEERKQVADEELETLPVSYPLEFCQGDFECRAGRTCRQGMCKCVPVSWCDHSVAVEEGFLATDETDVAYLPVCGTDGKRYRSHCHLHRTACVSRSHIRVDRHGAACSRSQQSDQAQEVPAHGKSKNRSWLAEQERLLEENQQKQEQTNTTKMADKQEQSHMNREAENKVIIPEQDIVHFPTKGEKTSSVKKDGPNVLSSENLVRPLAVREQCTWSQMNEFKDALLMYYCHKFVEPNCPLEVKTERQYLSMLMYSYYDKDFDYFLTAQELDDKERDEHFDKHLVRNCHLQDFVKFADTIGEADGKLTITEFSKAFELTNLTQQPPAKVEVISTLASAGNGLELKCGIESDSVIWKKQGAQLSDDKRSHQLMVFDDGALFFSKVGLHHIGNYTCMDAEDTSLSQIHRLRVQTIPKVTVNPITQSSSRGLDIELKCHAEGVPKPKLHWSKGEADLHTTDRTAFYYDGGHVVIHDANPEYDSGTYTCIAHNQAGTTRKSVSVSVRPKDVPVSKESFKEAGTFVVFHRQGITAYDPARCIAKHNVKGVFGNFKFIPDAMDEPLTLCKPDSDCQWGSAVRVGADFIYASQPDQNRVVVVEASGSWRPIQVIDTDARPGKMWYVSHLDQVWVLCEGQPGSAGTNIIVVIRDASQHIQHRSVHTRPVGNHFDMVEDLFIAPSNDLDHEFDYGYVAHKGQKGLFKINLEDMSYTKALDLSSYGCVPTHVAFVPIGGHIVTQCVSASDQHSLQLILDYLTDTVTSTISLSGQPMTSPDSRHLITVDKLTGRVNVASISEEGVMATTYEVTVSDSISDVAFMPAATHPGYDLILTSADDDDVIIMNLVTGKVEKISGSRYTSSAKAWRPSGVKRRITTGDTLSSFLMTPAMSSVDILDITFRQVECEFSNLESDVIIHVPSWQTS